MTVASLKETRLRNGGARRFAVNGRDGHEHLRLGEGEGGAISGVSAATAVLDSRQEVDDSQADTITLVRSSPVVLK